jgi:hypothetical protein
MRQTIAAVALLAQKHAQDHLFMPQAGGLHGIIQGRLETGFTGPQDDSLPATIKPLPIECQQSPFQRGSTGSRQIMNRPEIDATGRMVPVVADESLLAAMHVHRGHRRGEETSRGIMEGLPLSAELEAAP